MVSSTVNNDPYYPRPGSAHWDHFERGYKAGQQEGPNISSLDSALQRQWDHAANGHLGKIDIKPLSHWKVWWMCPDGHLHRWEASVDNRSRGRGCPQCIGRKVCKHNSLATKAPLVAAQWDFETNEGTPDGVVAQSNQRVGWLCDVCGHKWSATITSRVGKKKRGCPNCTKNARAEKGISHPTFAGCNHPLLAEWDHKRNAAQGHFPDKIKLKSSKQIFWLCPKCPVGQKHSWSARPSSRTGRIETGCPFCVGRACKCNSLQAIYPGIAADWNHSKNSGQPSDYTASSTHLAWWSSAQRGSWQQTIKSRTMELHQGPARRKRIQKRQNSA